MTMIRVVLSMRIVCPRKNYGIAAGYYFRAQSSRSLRAFFVFMTPKLPLQARTPQSSFYTL
jgi:hypothetical protein